MAWGILYAPWRSAYIRSVAGKPMERCIFCGAPKRSDEDALILYRGKLGYVIMNLYPYNAGHVMVVPYRHVASIEDLSVEEAAEMARLVKMSLQALRRAMNPHGFNIGVNIGRAAGAGVEGHVHIHVVPRWHGDANFMTVVGGVRVISQDVRETYKLLKEAFNAAARDKD